LDEFAVRRDQCRFCTCGFNAIESAKRPWRQVAFRETEMRADYIPGTKPFCFV
jgi:hypothetical protein